MDAIDLKNELKKYKKGWVAFNASNKIVEHAISFGAICKKVEKYDNKEKFLLIPASDNYFGFIT